MAEDLTAELLCAHHSLENFDSGHPESDMLAESLLNQIRDLQGESFYALVVADANHNVTGILAATDLFLLPEIGEAKCLFYYLLAIDRAHQRGYRTQRLLLNGIEAMRRRWLFERDDYIGEVAVPMRGALDPQDRQLIAFLERRRFFRLEPGGDIWMRPKDPPAEPAA